MAPRPSRLFHGFRFDVVRLLILDIQCIRTFAVRLFRDACTFFVVIMGGGKKERKEGKSSLYNSTDRYYYFYPINRDRISNEW